MHFAAKAATFILASFSIICKKFRSVEAPFTTTRKGKSNRKKRIDARALVLTYPFQKRNMLAVRSLWIESGI